MVSREKEKGRNLLICKSKYGAWRSIVAQKDSHEAWSSEDNSWGSEGIRHHGCMVSKHLTHVVLYSTKKKLHFSTNSKVEHND